MFGKRHESLFFFYIIPPILFSFYKHLTKKLPFHGISKMESVVKKKSKIKKRKSDENEEEVIMKIRKLMTLTGAVVMAAGLIAGCSSSSTQAAGTHAAADTAAESATEEKTGSVAAGTETAAGTNAATLSGSISMSGSTSMEKVSNALCESFMKKYPDVTVTVEFTGSSAGVESVLSGKCDIGNSSRNLKEEEKINGAAENIMAIDGIAVAVDPKNKVTDLTKDQLTGIYTGQIKNWSEIGGDNMPIVVVGREAGSGTRGAFEEILKVEDACTYANELDSTGAVMAKVASTPGAIGYISLDAVDDSVIALKLDGVEPTAENIKAGTYFLNRPFVMATNGEISAQNELVQAWFDYVLSAEGQEVVKSVGLITVE